ncbi:hypothetical protein HK405_002800 [Cladochytrium tenue]|nr:hypothetical protein HK405_002800 [Cladochytrium tenue]
MDYEMGSMGGLAGEYYFGDEPNFGITINPLALSLGKTAATGVMKPAKTPRRYLAPPQPQEVQQGHNGGDLSDVVLDAVPREAPQTLQNGGRPELSVTTPKTYPDTLVVDSASVTATLKRKVVTRVAVSARTTRTTTTTVRETVDSGCTVVGEHAAVVTTTSTADFLRVLPSSAAASLDTYETVGGSRNSFTKSDDTLIAPFDESHTGPLCHETRADAEIRSSECDEVETHTLDSIAAASLTELRSSSWRSSEPRSTGPSLEEGVGVTAALPQQASWSQQQQRRVSAAASSPLVVQRGVVPANRGFSGSDAAAGGGGRLGERPGGRCGPATGITTSEDDLVARSAAGAARRSLPATPVVRAPSLAMKLHPLGTAAFATIGTRAASLPQQLSPTTRLGLAAAAAAAATAPCPVGLAGIVPAAQVPHRWNSAATQGSNAPASAAARRASSRASTAFDRDAGFGYDDDGDDCGGGGVDDVERSNSLSFGSGLHLDKPAPPVRFKGSAGRQGGGAWYADSSASTLTLAAGPVDDHDDGTA